MMPKRKSVYPGALIYDWILEPPLRSMKSWIAQYILRNDLFPVIDICCGTGKQAGLLQRDPASRGIIGVDLDCRITRYAHSRHSGVSFICGDAGRLPVKSGVFKGAIISFALHDKPADLRAEIVAEITRLLRRDGRILFLDFERPWSGPSRLGAVLTFLIERLAGGEHYRNGREFLRSGGLKGFLFRNGLIEVERRNAAAACSGIVVAGFPEAV